MKVGLILEGGAYRGIYTTGVLKVLNKYNITFDYICGVSAGAGNIVDFVTKRDDMSKSFISMMNKESSIGFKQLVKSGQFLNIDKMAKNLMTTQNNEIADMMMNTPIDIEVVCSNCLTGNAEYLFERKSVRKLIEIVKASCSVPIISKPIVINGIPYVDGSVTDAVPVKRALSVKKCDKVVVILTKKEGTKPTDYSRFPLTLRTHFHSKYPKMEYVLNHRVEKYYKQQEYIKAQEKAGKVFIIRPTIKGIGKFEKDISKIQNFYLHGVDSMEHRMGELQRFLEN